MKRGCVADNMHGRQYAWQTVRMADNAHGRSHASTAKLSQITMIRGHTCSQGEEFPRRGLSINFWQMTTTAEDDYHFLPTSLSCQPQHQLNSLQPLGGHMSQRLGVPVAVAPDCSDCSECSCMKTGGIMQTGSSTAVHAELNMHLCRRHWPLHVCHDA